MTKKFICDFKVSGKGIPLFLIHGIGSNKKTWEELIIYLSKFFTVISYDLRGHGNSYVSKSNFKMNDLIQDLENLRNHLKIKHGYFAGHSLGGMIAPIYSLKFPKRVLKIGMLSTVAGRTIEDKKKINNVINQMEKNGIKNSLEKLTNRWFTDRFIKNKNYLVKKRLLQVLNTDPKVFLNVFKIYANTEMFPLLKKINHQTILITGENDLGCSPKHNIKMAKQIKDSQLVILPKLKHSILIESPEKVSKLMIDFFK